MNKQLLNKAQKIMAESETVTLSELEPFVHDTLKLFEALKQTFLNGSPEDKKEAEAIVAQLKQKFQGVVDKIYHSIHLSEAQAKALLVPENFPPETWAKYQNINKEMKEYQSTYLDPLLKKENSSRPSKHKEKM